ncbi:MAG: hypothetical protein RSA87_04020, partial [Malacoplasma sp.]
FFNALLSFNCLKILMASPGPIPLPHIFPLKIQGVFHLFLLNKKIRFQQYHQSHFLKDQQDKKNKFQSN